MTGLELLAPARNAAIGIAAIDCGADAVYIAGPAFGARKDAGNEVEDLKPLIAHAHKFGAKVFITFNIAVHEDELPAMHSLMLECQEAGADAFIIRDERICGWDDIRIPLHASTQCGIRNKEKALHLEKAGCSRIVLERELPLETVREICAATTCEVECFVHGALCVCYSGECRLSEHIDGRSADRGECIQACRSLYDLVDKDGNVIVGNKALLSLKDLNLLGRIGELADAGVMSFKIEGRLKSASYVKNVVRAYSLALDSLVANKPELFRRASHGHSDCKFTPSLEKTFNRGYTELFFDGTRGKWASSDAPKSMGEKIGTVEKLRTLPSGAVEITITPASGKISLHNGDGFAFIGPNSIEGFRGDVCEGRRIICKRTSGLRRGTILFRNISSAFEKELETECRRELEVNFDVRVNDDLSVSIDAACEDGRTASVTFPCRNGSACNESLAEAALCGGLGRRTEHFTCKVRSFVHTGPMPFFRASEVNSMRRETVSAIIETAKERENTPTSSRRRRDEAPTFRDSGKHPLMRSKYCIRYELGICPVHQGAKENGPLFLMNNGRRFSLGFDCRTCEMTVDAV